MLILWYTTWGLLVTTQAFPIPFWVLPSKSIAARSIDAPPEEADKIDFKDGIFNGLKKFVKRQWGGSYYPQSTGYYPQASYYPPVNPWNAPWPGTTTAPDTHQGDRGYSPCDSPQALTKPVSCSGGSFQIDTEPKGPYAGILGGGTERKGSFNAYAFGVQLTPAFQPFADFSKVVKGHNVKISFNHDDNNGDNNNDDNNNDNNNNDNNNNDNNNNDNNNNDNNNNNDDDPFNNNDNNNNDNADNNGDDSFSNFGNSRRESSNPASAGGSTSHLGVGAGKSIKHVGASLAQVGKAVGSLGDGVGGASKSLGNGIGKLPNGHLRRRKPAIVRP